MTAVTSPQVPRIRGHTYYYFKKSLALAKYTLHMLSSERRSLVQHSKVMLGIRLPVIFSDF